MTPSRGFFVDASFYIALLNKRDGAHPNAVAWQEWVAAHPVPLVTTEAVLWEWLDFFVRPPGRSIAYRMSEAIRTDPGIEIIAFESSLCAAAIRLYAERADKAWSVEDCLSFVVMRERGLTSALTADHHFEQAGFEALLLREPA